jgi:hypothetical protein
MAEQTVICPNCGKRIPISKALTSQIEADLRKAFDAEAAKREKETQAAFEKKLATETTRLEKQARKDAERAASAELSKIQRELSEAQKHEKAAQASFERKLAVEKARLEKQTRKDVEEEISAEMAELQEQLREKDKQVADVQKQQAQVQKLQTQLNAREKAIETEIARKVEKASRKVEEEISARIEEEHYKHDLELEKKLSDAKRQAVELKRKLEQGSQQTQGEVIELELGKNLKKTFPDDKIVPIAKGKAGADVLQKVYASNGQYCGAIIWESKNTQNWSKAWLTKLRTDQRREKVELAVLVSVALPKDVSHFAQVDGVWVTEFPLAMGVATALRINLMQAAVLKQSSKGKNEKMELLYEYLSGTEFKQRVEAIVEAFNSMQDDLEKERQTMEKQWAKREKHLQLVIENISGMYGDMQVIAGQSLPKIRRLELAAPNEL